MDAYWRKQFLWMLKLELEGQESEQIRPAFYYALVRIGEPLYFPAR